MLITVLEMVAETEREFILERQKAGIELAKGRGAYKGRKPTVSSEKVHDLKAEGLGATAIAKELNISRVHVHRLLRPSGEVANASLNSLGVFKGDPATLVAG